MKLAEALVLRADYQKRLEQLKFRLIRSAKVQEGDEPAEHPARLLAELEEVARQLAELIRRINRTNSVSTLRDGLTLSDALATRDVLLKRRGVYANGSEHKILYRLQKRLWKRAGPRLGSNPVLQVSPAKSQAHREQFTVTTLC